MRVKELQTAQSDISKVAEPREYSVADKLRDFWQMCVAHLDDDFATFAQKTCLTPVESLLMTVHYLSLYEFAKTTSTR
jgi:hypothetical protein